MVKSGEVGFCSGVVCELGGVEVVDYGGYVDNCVILVFVDDCGEEGFEVVDWVEEVGI